jgi:hypothetical protein
MHAFSPEHMDLLRPALGILTQAVVERWWEVAEKSLERFSRRELSRRGVTGSLGDDLRQHVMVRLLGRVREGCYASPAAIGDRRRFQKDIDNLVRTAIRRERTRERRWREVASQLTKEHGLSFASGRAVEIPCCTELALQHQRCAEQIRRLGLGGVHTLCLILVEVPGGYLRRDLDCALDSGLALGRDVGGTRRNLEDWSDRSVSWRIQHPEARRTGARRAELAFILRAGPDVEVLDDWSPEERRRGVNWLDQNLRRGRQQRERALEGFALTRRERSLGGAGARVRRRRTGGRGFWRMGMQRLAAHHGGRAGTAGSGARGYRARGAVIDVGYSEGLVVIRRRAGRSEWRVDG